MGRHERVRPAGAGSPGELLVSLLEPVGAHAGERRRLEVVGEVSRAIARVDRRDVVAEGVERRALTWERSGGGEQAERDGDDRSQSFAA